MSEIIFEVTEDEIDGGFIASALGHAIVTEADTWELLRVNVREAVLCHFDEGKAPAVIRLHRGEKESGLPIDTRSDSTVFRPLAASPWCHRC